MTHKIRQIALTGLAALAIGCGGGGGGGTVLTATEAEGRTEIRTRLQADKAIGKIDSWTEDPLVQVQGKDIFPDFSVEIGGIPSYMEYVSRTDNREEADAEITDLYNFGIDYCYIPTDTIGPVKTAVKNYADALYLGQHPEP